jgi:hypothetical protein
MLAARAGGHLRGSPRYSRRPGVCLFITAVPFIKLFAWGEGNSRFQNKKISGVFKKYALVSWYEGNRDLNKNRRRKRAAHKKSCTSCVK